MPLTQTQLLAFQAIHTCMKDLAGAFGKQQKSLALYARLIEHMQISNEVSIVRVVSGFDDYIRVNQAAIEAKDEATLQDVNIAYSDKIFLNLAAIFKKADAETKSVIWAHLLTIYAILYPTSKAKEILRTSLETPPQEATGAEASVIQEMIGKLQPHLSGGDGDNPMATIMGLVQSGVFAELMGTLDKGVNEKGLDPKSLLSILPTMMKSMGDPTDKLIVPEKKED
jgi:hypothetical protein